MCFSPLLKLSVKVVSDRNESIFIALDRPFLPRLALNVKSVIVPIDVSPFCVLSFAVP